MVKIRSCSKNFDTNKFDVLDTGYKASAIPGTVAGLLDAHAYFGKLELSEVLAPVIAQATNGIVVSYDLQKAIESTPRLYDDLESRHIYFKNDNVIKENSILKLPDLANTLTLISKHGKNGFYKGKTAKKIIQAMNDNGGLMQLEDFDQYKAVIRSPISTEYRGNKVFTAGPPSGGGITLLTALNILSFFELEKYKSNSVETYHLFSEALRRGHNNRSSEVGDPDYYDVPIDKLLSKREQKNLLNQ